MTTANVLQYVLFLIVVTLLVRPSGVYLQRVFERRHTWLDPLVSPLERGIYRLTGVDPEAQMDWRAYAASFVMFTLMCTLLLFRILLLQWALPYYDTEHITTPMTPDLAINVGVRAPRSRRGGAGVGRAVWTATDTARIAWDPRD